MTPTVRTGPRAPVSAPHNARDGPSTRRATRSAAYGPHSTPTTPGGQTDEERP